MHTFGLIGYPLEHSKSPFLFAGLFKSLKLNNVEYRLFPVSKASHIRETIQTIPKLIGFNVTIPYKQEVAGMCHWLSPEAEKTGAVNTVHIEHGRWKGYNTDVYGFEKSLLSFTGSEKVKALICGTGGASRAVQYVLQQQGMEFLTISRRAESGMLTYPDVDEALLRAFPLIIQTTPLGMAGYSNQMPPLPFAILTPQNMLHDLVYNPVITPFMKAGIKRGCIVKNGVQMLSLQARKAWQIWSQNIANEPIK